jgi:ribosomal protein S18 acetylase RimI-like enzyme
MHSLYRECPEGYILKPLKSDHAEFVSRYWEWIFVDFADKIKFFEGLINNFHSVGLFTTENPDQPIAWCLQYSNARLAHLYVMEEHRRKGFACLLYQYICEEIIADGLLPEVVVDEHNYIGINLVEKLGFSKSITHIGLVVKPIT